MKIKSIFVAASLCVLCISLSHVAHATAIYDLNCNDPECGYQGTVSIGGAMRAELITGYCAPQKKFVYLWWLRTEPDKAPKPIKVWDAEKGVDIELYKCPNSDDLFLPIKSIEQIKYCPVCHKEGIQYKESGVID